ncbi:DNA-binding response OmpR family regulator [Hydrogenispora ethanolica]|jgi:DNA-binding response OmpR family regulator|uniref:DNA-binding response OmpR family regulator n=1 Tax=Hydrogenispora ethanolica TaxID=1082276 RepID=A0A4R1QV91_HYDET|nr:response regulator transcription factor [Hydrogenispora ethanolica]TCL57879.1 DNA-binding response OmpR family regulator [Hydrogenispora ethanolica]
MKLLLVEDESKLAEALSHLLKKNGFVVDVALDGETGLEMACMGIYDIIVLDRMLPQQDGLSLLCEFRRLGHDTPVLILTAKDSPEDRAEGLNAGADDYLVKPFYSVELLARLQALGRRRNKDLVENVLVADDLVFDPMRGQVIKDGAVIQLTVKESQLLELLIRNHGRVVTKELIVQKVWGFNSDAEFTSVNLYVHYLRKKLNITNLKTVRGVGYYLQRNKNVAQTAN